MDTTASRVTRHYACLGNLLDEDRTAEMSTCDLVLTSQGKEFKVHKNVLMMFSDYFRNMFTIEMKEKYEKVIEIKEMPYQRLGNLIEFIYSGSITLTKENMFDVLQDALYAQIKSLESTCFEFISENISADNCLKAIIFARQCNNNKILNEAYEAIFNNMNKLQNNEGFLELDIKDLTTIVTWKKQHVAEDSFKAIVQWVNHNQSQRKNLFGSLFCQLQLTSVTHDALTRISEESLVKENLQCSNKLVKAFAQLKYPQCQHKFLLMGGYDSETDCVAFDVITKTSKYLPKLNFPRCAATTVKVGSRVYIVGGADNQGEGHPYQSCELLDLNDLENGWKPMSNMLEPRKWCRSGTCREKIYVTGGYDHQCLSSCEEFDIQNSKWMSISNMRQARYVHATVVLNDMVYCIGGVNNTTFHFSSCECYDVRSGKWNVIAPRNEARSGLASVVLDGKIYAIGGRDDGKRISTVETYIPEANKWLFVESLHLARSCPSACVLAGKIFVIGGWHGSSRLNSVEIFDPTTEDWSFSFKTKKPVYAATVAAI